MRSTEPPSRNQELIQHYVNHLERARRYSPHTLAAVRRDLRVIDVPLNTANIAQLKHILAKRHADGASPRSLARIASTWRGFYAFLLQERVRPDNPAELLKTPKATKSLPKAVGVDPLMALLDGPLPENFKWAQTHTLIELLYATGMRISEALSLQHPHAQAQIPDTASQLNLSVQEIRVRGKGNKMRVVPLIDTVVQRLHEHIARRSDHLQQLGITQQPASVFVNAKGHALSVRQAQQNIAEYAQQKGLGQHLHPHMLRHSFGSHVLQSTQNLRAVQELLGHASIASTQVYTALDFSHLASVYDKAFPRAKSNN